MAKTQLKVNVDQSLLKRLGSILAERQLTLDQAVGLYLRGMVNSSASARALRLQDEMPFGKFQGVLVETILRAQPDYIKFINAQGRTRFDPEVLLLLETLTGPSKETDNGS